MRNFAAHYDESAPEIQANFGTPPNGYIQSWLRLLGNRTVLSDAWVVAINFDEEPNKI
jgi:hypothetical protein